MASQVEQVFKVDKGFKPHAFNAAIIVIKDEFGIIVNEVNVTNNLRTIHKCCVRIENLKELSEIGKDNRLKMIIIGEAEFRNYVKVQIYLELISIYAF